MYTVGGYCNPTTSVDSASAHLFMEEDEPPLFTRDLHMTCKLLRQGPQFTPSSTNSGCSHVQAHQPLCVENWWYAKRRTAKPPSVHIKCSCINKDWTNYLNTQTCLVSFCYWNFLCAETQLYWVQPILHAQGFPYIMAQCVFDISAHTYICCIRATLTLWAGSRLKASLEQIHWIQWGLI